MLGFIFGLIGGFVTPSLDGALARPVAKAMSGFIEVEEGEIRLLGFLLVMLIVGILCAIFNTGSVPGVLVGAALGYFLLRISFAIKALIDNKG